MKKIALLLVIALLMTLALTSCGKCPEGSHDYVEEVISEPTADTPGLSSFTCTICGDTYTIERYSDDYEDTTAQVTEPEPETEAPSPTGNYDEKFSLKRERHINANESLLSLVDPTYWDDDEWDIHDISVEDGTLKIECTADFGTNLRFILSDGYNADIAVSTEQSESGVCKGQKYEDIGKCIFDENVTSWDERFSIDSEEFEMTIEIPLSDEISNASDLFLKFNIELPTTSGGWSIDTYYLRLTFDR